jgi:hypothetical protein
MRARALTLGVFPFLVMVMAVSVSTGLVSTPAWANDVYTVVKKPTLKPGMAVPAPSEPVILTVKGDIAVGPGKAAVARFDIPDLEKLGVVRFTTPTSWTDGPTTFEGVLLSSLLKFVGADDDAEKLELRALNDYKAEIPAGDANKWPVMLALKENGEYMPIRTHGPVWVVYPQHAYPKLGKREYLSRWVWQLKEITVK